MAAYGCEKRPDGSYTYNGPCEGCGKLVVHNYSGKDDTVPGHQPCLSMWVNHDLMLDGVRVGSVRYGAMGGAVTWAVRCASCDPVGFPGTRPKNVATVVAT